MPLEVRQYDDYDHEPDNDWNVRKIDAKWAAREAATARTWIWGFETKEDAQIVANALEESASNAADAAYGS